MQPASDPSPDIFERLKATTADVHQRVEEKLQIFTPEFDLSEYVRLVRCFYGFWAPLERELGRVTELRDPALALESRLKAHLLEADLRFFGMDPSAVTACPPPRIDTFFNGLGCLYVLEGSTLGAQFVAKHIKVRFDIDDGSGGSFFNAYRSEVGKRWSAFRRFVMVQAEAGPEQEILSAARATFEGLDQWLAR